MKKSIPSYSIQIKNIEFKNKNINLGIQFLRFLLCVWIVIIHCSPIKKNHRKYFNKGFHVPTFILLSFYFYYPIISNKNIAKVNSRFQRLLLPYIFWPLVRLIFRLKNRNGEFTLKNCCLQILIGCPIHQIFWFQFNLIFLSLFFAIILFPFNKKRINILLFIGLFCYYLHLSGLINNIINRYNFYFRYNIGSLIELAPLAVNGSILNSINKNLIEVQYPVFFNLFLFSIVFILFQYDIFLKRPGYRYSNVSLNMISSLILFLFFRTLSFKKIGKYTNIIIKSISQFTGGIYYAHTIVRDILKKYSISFFKVNYAYALLIYIICFFICLSGNKLFNNSKLKYHK